MEDESELRHWLKENVGTNVKIQWIEPGRYGSTIGAPDCNLSCGLMTVGLELKIWKETKRGIKCEMRPVQRRFHHISMKNGTRTAVLAAVNDYIILVRGDFVPKRNYADDPDSGCLYRELHCERIFHDLNRYLFDESYGFWL